MNPGPPGFAKLGDSEIRPGADGDVIVNGKDKEAPLSGEYTVMPAVPVVPISDARIEPCNWLEFKNVVVRVDPFH
jgi:hypothetical protein